MKTKLGQLVMILGLLLAFAVPRRGEPVLENPVLKLMSGATELRANDDWQSESNSDDIVSTTIPPLSPRESSILIRLEPGSYTAVVTGADDTTGIALIEIYEIDHD